MKWAMARCEGPSLVSTGPDTAIVRTSRTSNVQKTAVAIRSGPMDHVGGVWRIASGSCFHVGSRRNNGDIVEVFAICGPSGGLVNPVRFDPDNFRSTLPPDDLASPANRTRLQRTRKQRINHEVQPNFGGLPSRHAVDAAHFVHRGMLTRIQGPHALRHRWPRRADVGDQEGRELRS